MLTSAGTLGPINGSYTTGTAADELNAAMTPLTASLTVGTTSVTGNNVIRYTGVLSGPSSFGPGAITSLPTASTGTLFGILGAANELAVDANQALLVQDITAGTSTWSATTLAALGVTPGTYTWTVSGVMLDSGTDDTVVLNIVDPSDVPVPATLPLVGLGLAGLGLAARRRKPAA